MGVLSIASFQNLEIKKKFFADLGKLCKPDTIFGSNTSSFPITQLVVNIPVAIWLYVHCLCHLNRLCLFPVRVSPLEVLAN